MELAVLPWRPLGPRVTVRASEEVTAGAGCDRLLLAAAAAGLGLQLEGLWEVSSAL